MSYRLNRELADGVENVPLGIPEVGPYLKFVRNWFLLSVPDQGNSNSGWLIKRG